MATYGQKLVNSFVGVFSDIVDATGNPTIKLTGFAPIGEINDIIVTYGLGAKFEHYLSDYGEAIRIKLPPKPKPCDQKIASMCYDQYSDLRLDDYKLIDDGAGSGANALNLINTHGDVDFLNALQPIAYNYVSVLGPINGVDVSSATWSTGTLGNTNADKFLNRGLLKGMKFRNIFMSADADIKGETGFADKPMAYANTGWFPNSFFEKYNNANYKLIFVPSCFNYIAIGIQANIVEAWAEGATVYICQVAKTETTLSTLHISLNDFLIEVTGNFDQAVNNGVTLPHLISNMQRAIKRTFEPGLTTAGGGTESVSKTFIIVLVVVLIILIMYILYNIQKNRNVNSVCMRKIDHQDLGWFQLLSSYF